MLPAAPRFGAIRTPYAHDLQYPLGEYGENRRRPTIGTDHLVAGSKVAERTPSHRGQDGLRDGLKLPHSAIREHTPSPSDQSELDEMGLERKEEVRHPHGRESVLTGQVRLPSEKRRVVAH